MQGFALVKGVFSLLHTPRFPAKRIY